jgi:hypothetical protein
MSEGMFWEENREKRNQRVWAALTSLFSFSTIFMCRWLALVELGQPCLIKALIMHSKQDCFQCLSSALH